MKAKYDEDFTEESLREKFQKGRAGGNLHQEGRDNTGNGFDYTKTPDRSDLAAYIKKLTKVTVSDDSLRRRK